MVISDTHTVHVVISDTHTVHVVISDTHTVHVVMQLSTGASTFVTHVHIVSDLSSDHVVMETLILYVLGGAEGNQQVCMTVLPSMERHTVKSGL